MSLVSLVRLPVRSDGSDGDPVQLSLTVEQSDTIQTRPASKQFQH